MLSTFCTILALVTTPVLVGAGAVGVGKKVVKVLEKGEEKPWTKWQIITFGVIAGFFILFLWAR